MKSKFTLWSVVLLLAGFIFVGCDNERTENASDFQTGIHKIVIQQSDRKSTRLNSSHIEESRMPSSA